MSVERFAPDHGLWPAYRAHLARHGMERWVIGKDDRPLADLFFLGVAAMGQVIGHITLKVQPITLPATEWSDNQPVYLADTDGDRLHETFVQTFAVDEAHRRQGHGRALQLAALALTRNLGCYQMRSWSSADKTANYALKLSLGFAVHPSVMVARPRQRISGVYFVKTV
jgi:GNAT superfamily N-acetyltransferase